MSLVDLLQAPPEPKTKSGADLFGGPGLLLFSLLFTRFTLVVAVAFTVVVMALCIP